jgi:hypothetical protein
MPMAESRLPIRVDWERHHQVTFLTISGVLDSATYRGIRDAVIKAALDEPRAVIADVNDLSVPSASAWSVFTSARWHVSTWPDVPILLVCADPARRQEITRIGVARYVPVHATHESAVDAVADRSLHGRRRARTQLPASPLSVGLARDSVADWLTAWQQRDLIPVAATIATVFVENVLAHTDSAPMLILESDRAVVTVVVQDGSPVPPSRREDADSGVEIVSGLAIVSALCRAWGSTPTSSGKTVWAVVGRENQL